MDEIGIGFEECSMQILCSKAKRLGAGACASEILGIEPSLNVNTIKGTHYFHQSTYALNSIILIQRKSTY